MAIFRNIIRPGTLGLAAAIILLPAAAEAQITTLNRNDTEKRPTSRDPRYIPPSLPEYLREKLDTAPGAPISPTGEINAQTILRAQGVRAAAAKRSRHEAKGYTDSANTFADRLLFTDSVLRQFGIDSLPPRAPEIKVRETESRRFQVVYFLSLPYTLGISYAAFAAATNQLGGRVVFDGPQTAGFISVGLLFSGFVAWYDNRRWHEVQAAHRAREQLRKKIKTPAGKNGFLRENQAGARAYSFSLSPMHAPPETPLFSLTFRVHY